MDDEQYEVSLVLEIAATSHNYATGNIYVQAFFKSYRTGTNNLNITRQAYLNPRGPLHLAAAEIFSYIPVLPYFLPVFS